MVDSALYLDGDATRSLRFGQRLAERVPPWLGSIRVRLTLLYSILLFGLASIVVGGIYTGLARSLNDQPISKIEREYVMVPLDDKVVVTTAEVERIDPLAAFERDVNTRALEKLRQYSFGALALLFVGSLAVGWFVADMVLRPIGRITGVARDISATDLKRRINLRGPNDELRQLADTFDNMIARLNSSFEGQRHFIQEASHELRNPLAVIRTNVDVVLSDADADVDDHRHVNQVVSSAAERMSILVDDLLLSARYESPEVRLDEVDLHTIVKNTAEEFGASADAEDVELSWAAEPNLILLGDAAALRRLVANLVVNALRHTPAGNQIRVGAGRVDTWFWLAVSDQGAGIADADKPRIFNRFFRGDGPSNRKDSRTGLGLTIVSQIAESHDGQVVVRSTEKVGSTFLVWIPATRTAGEVTSVPPIELPADAILGARAPIAKAT